MTIPKITPYSGGVANPDGSQTQTEFTQNMFDQLSYEAELSTELNSTVDGINDTATQVDTDAASAAQSAAAAEAAVSGLNYQGLWPDTGGSANKGDTYQTQVIGTPTGQYFTALQNTIVDPVGDDVNWREVISSNSIGLQEIVATGSTEPRSISDRAGDFTYTNDYLSPQHAVDANKEKTILLSSSDIELNDQINGYGQSFVGTGGKITSSTANPALFFDGLDREGASVRDISLKSTGVEPASSPAYSLFFRGMSYPRVKGLFVDGYTGGVISTKTKAALHSDICSVNSVYHPSLVAGGYGVLLQNTNEAINTNVHFYAGDGDDNGRHALYISRADDATQDYCQNTVSSNIIAKYENKDDRNFWGLNTRKSVNTVTSSFIIDGANGGVSLFPEDGVIKNHINANGVVKVEKYADGTAVYGLSQLATSDRVEGFIDSNLILEVKPKVGASLSDGECIAYNLSGIGGMVTNVVTNVPSGSSPFTIQGLTSNVLISNIVDIVDDDGTKEPMFSFVGPAADVSYDITIKNIVTNRPMFNYDRLILIGKNITVDWIRTATMTSAVIDDNEHSIVERVAAGSSGVTVVFYDHVTEEAIESASVRLLGDSNVGSEVITGSDTTTLSIRLFDRTTGAIVDPTVTNVTYTVILDR